MSGVKVIQISESSNFAKFESYLEDVLTNECSTLHIPNALSYSGSFGMEGAALQVFATWLRHSKEHVLITSVPEKINSEQFFELCNRLFGLCVLRLSDKILTSNGEAVDLSFALKSAVPIFSKMRSESFKDAFEGLYLTIPAIKSPFVKGAKSREFDSPLYNGDNVVGAQKFESLTIKALEAILPEDILVSQIPISIVRNISEILRELITNTHRHARTDVLGNPIDKNFRGIIFNIADLTKGRLEEISKSGGVKLAAFVGDWKLENDGRFQALDITVVDSGPGYARRWAQKDKQDLIIEEEIEAIVECFKKHRSSDSFESAGSGLSNVLQDLRMLKGWFRLRTGRTLVEKSFFNNQGASWISNTDVKIRNSFAEGVVFNIVIPLQSLIER